MSKKFGIVEDEPITAEFVKQVLRKNGHECVFVCSNAKTTLEKIVLQQPDIIFVDINLHGKQDGIWLAKELRHFHHKPKVIFITAYVDEETIEEALSVLPCDFIAKPFTQKDLEISLNLAIKRLELQDKAMIQTEKDCLIFSNSCYFSLKTQTLYRDNMPLKLSTKEYKLLSSLCKKPNTYISYNELFLTIWEEKEISESTMRDLIYRLRKKVPELEIDALASIGYRLVVNLTP